MEGLQHIVIACRKLVNGHCFACDARHQETHSKNVAGAPPSDVLISQQKLTHIQNEGLLPLPDKVRADGLVD